MFPTGHHALRNGGLRGSAAAVRTAPRGRAPLLPSPPRAGNAHGPGTPPVGLTLALRVKLTLWVLGWIAVSSWLGANAPYFFLWSCIAVVWLTPW